MREARAGEVAQNRGLRREIHGAVVVGTGPRLDGALVTLCARGPAHKSCGLRPPGGRSAGGPGRRHSGSASGTAASAKHQSQEDGNTGPRAAPSPRNPGRHTPRVAPRLVVLRERLVLE